VGEAEIWFASYIAVKKNMEWDELLWICVIVLKMIWEEKLWRISINYSK